MYCVCDSCGVRDGITAQKRENMQNAFLNAPLRGEGRAFSHGLRAFLGISSSPLVPCWTADRRGVGTRGVSGSAVHEFFSLSMSIYLSIYLYICLSIYLHILDPYPLSFPLTIALALPLSFSLYLSMYLCIYLSLSIYLSSIYLSISSISVFLSVFLMLWLLSLSVYQGTRIGVVRGGISVLNLYGKCRIKWAVRGGK